MGLGTHRNFAVLVLLLAFTVAGCSSSSVNTQQPPPSSSSGASPSIDPRAQPAVAAYQAFVSRANAALRHPLSPQQKPSPDADFAAYSFDPLRAQYESTVWGLQHDGVVFRGTPPTPNIHVVSIDLGASSWPTVTLHDCETNDSDWHGYNAKTGARIPETTPSVPLPYEATVTMIQYQGHWGARQISLDRSQTCSG